MLIGNIMSILARIFHIPFGTIYYPYPDYERVLEYMFYAASAYFFEVYAAVAVFLLGALFFLLMVHGCRSTKCLIIFLIVVPIVGLLFNNRGWLVVLPILLMMLEMIQSTIAHRLREQDMLPIKARENVPVLFGMYVMGLAAWSVYSVFAGDFVTLFFRLRAFGEEIFYFLKYEVFDKEKRLRRHRRWRYRKYKR